MPTLSPVTTHKHTEMPKSKLSFDWKTSDSVDNLLTIIAGIIAHEYVETARLNPEIFTEIPPFKHSNAPIETISTSSTQSVKPKLLVMEILSETTAGIPTLPLPLSGKGGNYNVRKAL